MARPRTLPDHVCPGCGGRYRPNIATQVFCSRACRFDSVQQPSLITEIDLRAEIEAAKQERATAPLYRYWERRT